MLKLQYSGHLMQRANSLEKTLMLGKIEERGQGQQRMRCLDGIIDSMDMSLLKVWEGRTRKPGMLQSTGLQRIWHMTDRVNNSNNLWTQTFSLFAMPGFSQMLLCTWQLAKMPLTSQTQIVQNIQSQKLTLIVFFLVSPST